MSIEIPTVAAPEVLTKVVANQSANKTNYHSRSSLNSTLEGVSRTSFSAEHNAIKRTEATSYLRGETNNDKALEIIVSPKDSELFRYVGDSSEEQREILTNVTRQAMQKLLAEMEITDARWVGVLHQNTDNTHLHILLSEQVKVSEGADKLLKLLPKEMLTKNADGFSRLDLAFSSALREQLNLTPENVRTFMAKQSVLPPIETKRLEETLVSLRENGSYSPKVLNNAQRNSILLSSDQAEAVFVRRDLNGIVTGANWRGEDKSWKRTGFNNGGWFYLGNPSTAESIVLVSSPEEALALQTTHSHRDLRKVAIIALEPHRLDQELAELILSRQNALAEQDKEIKVVWATNSTRSGRQYTQGLRELKNYISQKSQEQHLNEIKFTAYSRGSSWIDYSRTQSNVIEVKETLTKSLLKDVTLPRDLSFTETKEILPELLSPRVIESTKTVKNIEIPSSEENQSTDNIKPASSKSKDELNKLSYREVTNRVKEIPLTEVAALMGLRETRIKGENVWIDGAETKRIKISGELFSDRKNGRQGGKGTIDFVAYLQDLPKETSFKEARTWLVDNYGIEPSVVPFKTKNKNSVEKPALEMPPIDATKSSSARFYLEVERAISPITLDKLSANGTFYANNYGSPVFVHRNFDGYITGASWRSVEKGSTLRGNATGTDKDKGLFYLGDPSRAEKYILTEAPIDAISYYDLESLNEVDLSKTAIISLGGDNTPKFLIEFLAKRQVELEINQTQLEVIFATDNDRAGERAFDKFLTGFEEVAPGLFNQEIEDEEKEKVKITRQVPGEGKDWNDLLKIETSQADYPDLEELVNFVVEQKLDPTTEVVLPETPLTESIKVEILEPEMVVRGHSRTGEQLYIVDLKTRVPMDVYQQLEIEAETLAGFYQKGYKPADVPSGFRFKDENKAQEFLKKVTGISYSFSRLVQEQAYQIIAALPSDYAQARTQYNELIAQKEDAELYFESEEYAIVANYLKEMEAVENSETAQKQSLNMFENTVLDFPDVFKLYFSRNKSIKIDLADTVDDENFYFITVKGIPSYAVTSSNNRLNLELIKNDNLIPLWETQNAAEVFTIIERNYGVGDIENFKREVQNNPIPEQPEINLGEGKLNGIESITSDASDKSNDREPAGISARPLSNNGNGLSGGVSSESIQTDDTGEDTRIELSENGRNGVGSLPFGTEAGLDGITSNGVRTGEITADSNTIEVGTGNGRNIDERSVSATLDQIGGSLEEEKKYRFKLRSQESDEFLQYQTGFNPATGNWETHATGLVGSKDETRKKVENQILSALGLGSDRLESLKSAIGEINRQISVFDEPTNEFAPLYEQIYVFHQTFLTSFEPVPVEVPQKQVPSDIKKITQNEQGFQVIFNDGQFTRSYSYRKDDGSRDIRTREDVILEASEWRKDCDLRFGIIDDKAKYLNLSEALSLHADGKNIIAANLCFDNHDKLWRGQISIGMTLNGEKVILKAQPVSLLNHGFETRDEILANLTEKAIEKLEKRAELTNPETKKMFQDVISDLQSKQAQFLGFKFERSDIDENERKQITNQNEDEKLSQIVRTKPGSRFTFERNQENGQIIVRPDAQGKFTEAGLTPARLAAENGFEDILNTSLDFLETGKTDTKLWFANAQDFKAGKPLLSLTDKPVGENEFVVIADKSENPFKLDKEYHLRDLRRINLTAARQAEVMAFDLQSEAIQVQKIKGSVFYTALVKEVSGNLYQNVFGLLSEDEQMKVLETIESTFAGLGYDAISNTIFDGKNKVQSLRGFTGNWQPVGQFLDRKPELKLSENLSETKVVNNSEEIKVFGLTAESRLVLGEEAVKNIFKHNAISGLDTILNSVTVEVNPSMVYVAATDSQIETIIEQIRENFNILPVFEESESKNERAYALSLRKPDFELSRETYIEKRIWQTYLGYESQIIELESEIDDLENRETLPREQIQQLQKLHVSLATLNKAVEDARFASDGQREAFGREYEISVARDIKKGLVSPERRAELATESPVLQQTIANRERVEKSSIVLATQKSEIKQAQQERASELVELIELKHATQPFAKEAVADAVVPKPADALKTHLIDLQQIFNGEINLTEEEIPIFSRWLDEFAGELYLNQTDTNRPINISKKGNVQEVTLTEILHRDVSPDGMQLKHLLTKAELPLLNDVASIALRPSALFRSLTEQYLVDLNNLELPGSWTTEQFEEMRPALELQLAERIGLIERELGLPILQFETASVSIPEELPAEQIEAESKPQKIGFYDLYVPNAANERINLDLPNRTNYEVLGFNEARDVVLYKIGNNFGVAFRHEDSDTFSHFGTQPNFAECQKEFVQTVLNLDKSEDTNKLEKDEIIFQKLYSGLDSSWAIEPYRYVDEMHQLDTSAIEVSKDYLTYYLLIEKTEKTDIKVIAFTGTIGVDDDLIQLYTIELSSIDEFIKRVKEDSLFDEKAFFQSLQDDLAKRVELFDFELNPDRESTKRAFLEVFTEEIKAKSEIDFRFRFVTADDAENLFNEVENIYETQRAIELEHFAIDATINAELDELENLTEIGWQPEGQPQIVSPKVDDILLDYSVETDNSPESLEKWIELFPQYETELRQMSDLLREEPTLESSEVTLTLKEEERLNELSKANFDKWKESQTTKVLKDNIKIEYQDFIKREDLRNNRDKLYIFGDNLEGVGYGGQAKEMRGEINAFGIPTKNAPNNKEESFFSDATFAANKRNIDASFSILIKGLQSGKYKSVVFPSAGIGTGLAKLDENAPKTFDYLKERLSEIGWKENVRTNELTLEDLSNAISRKTLLLPEVFELNSQEFENFEKIAERLDALGYETLKLSNRTIALKTIPLHSSTDNVLEDFLDFIKNADDYLASDENRPVFADEKLYSAPPKSYDEEENKLEADKELQKSLNLENAAKQENLKLVLKPSSEQNGRPEQRIAKLFHSLGLADDIGKKDDLYVLLENEPWMPLHVTKTEDVLRLTYWYEQNGDLMHDGELVFNVNNEGSLTLTEVGTALFGTPRYSYDRSYAEMFSKNVIDQGYEKALVLDGREETPYFESEQVKENIEIETIKENIETTDAEIQPPTQSTIPTLNENEHKVFVSLGQQILDCTNGQFGYASDAEIPDGMTQAQFSGYISQLTQKKYFQVTFDEFSQLLIDENFEEYANKNNLFVGKAFEIGTGNNLSIIGNQLEVENNHLSSPNESNKVETVEITPSLQKSQYQIKPESFEEYSEGGLKTKFRRNMDALQLLETLESEERLATPEEQEILAKFSGWGGLKEAFNTYQPKPEWKKEIAELRAFYNPDDKQKDSEYFAARRSADNAHYTSPEVVDKMWQIVQKLGFDSGKVLEPAAGVGNFLGLIPENLQNRTHFTAIEKEESSARLTTQLYQKSRVITSGFEQTNLPDNSFDLVISNFPFGSFSVHDPAYNALKPSIHNYFFLKSLDKVREGGLVVALTSRYTMDSAETNVREAIARRADLVGAFRLPETAFKGNAKTEVVTDLLIFQKRNAENQLTPDEIKELPWINAEKTELDDETTAVINNYFAENKENIFGQTSREGRMYGAYDFTVKVESEQEMLVHFDRVLETLPQIYQRPIIQRELSQPTGLSFDQIEQSKEGSIVVSENGAIFRVNGGVEEQLKLSPADTAKTAALIGIREKVKEIFSLEINNESADTARSELNILYDTFYEKYGVINSPKTLGLLEGDPEMYLVKTLETYVNEKRNTAEKASIFFESTLRGYSAPEKVATLNDAVLISLNEFARIELPRVAELLQKTEEEIAAEFNETGRAFYNHETEEWDIAEQYLAGNVKAKLQSVMEYAALSDDNQAQVQSNINALLEIQPADIPYTEIEVNLGASWIPPKDVKDFLIHLTKGTADSIRVEKAVSTGQWSLSWNGNSSSKWTKQNDASTKVWGTSRLDVMKLAQCALDGRPAHVTDKETVNGKEINVTNLEETQLANQKIMEITTEFKDWIWSDTDRRQRLARSYNEIKNTTVERSFDGSFLTLPNSNPMVHLRPHQKDAVWRTLQQPASYLAHDVGTGKTIVLGASLIEKKRLGQAKKPVLTCMKANIKQVTAEIQKLYPTARIFSGENGFDADKRKTIVSNIATNNYDLVILTYNQLDSIPFSRDYQQQYVNNELREVNDALATALESEGKKSRMVSRLNKRVNSLESQLEKILDQPKDDVVTFEETGMDCIGIDEAHNFKGLSIYTTMSNVKGIPNSRSDRAINMHMRSQYLADTYGEVRMVMASGTPVTNTVAETYNIMRYLMPDKLKEQGINSFDDFARDYTRTVSKIEPTVTGSYKEQSRLAEFINTPELRALLGEVMDVVTADDAGILRPQKQEIVVSVPISNEQIEFRKDLKKRANIMHTVDPKDDNFLKLMNDGRLMAIDMRLVDAEAEDHPNSKVNHMVANVLRISQENPKATQLIFSNLGVAKNQKTGHSVFDDVVTKLSEGGIPKERIANFSNLSDKKRKEAIEKLNSGEILVALGSTDTLGTGVNAQKFIKASHNLDVPWLPSAIEQRDGRSLRFGNVYADKNEDIDFYRYVTQGTFDAIGWDTIRRKTEFINQVITNKLDGNRHFEEPDAEEFSAAQISAIAAGNPDVLRKLELDDKIKQFEGMEKRHRQIGLELADTIPGKEALVNVMAKQRDNLKIDYDLYRNQREADGDKFKVILNGEEHTDYEKVSAVLSAEMMTCTGRKEIGEFCGFKVIVERQTAIGWSLSHPVVSLESPVTNQGYRFNTDDSQKIAEGMAAHLAYLKTQSEVKDKQVEREQTILDDIKEQANKPFRFKEDLINAKAEMVEVQSRLRDWNQEQATEQEKSATLKIEILKPGVDNEVKQIAAEQIKESLEAILDTRPTITVPTFVSREDTEATIRGLTVSEIKPQFEINNPDIFDDEEIEAGLFDGLDQEDVQNTQIENAANSSDKPVLPISEEIPIQSNLFESVATPHHSPMNAPINEKTVTAEDVSQTDFPNQETTPTISDENPENIKQPTDPRNLSILKAQMILAQAEVAVLERELQIQNLTAFRQPFLIKDESGRILDKREFIEVAATGSVLQQHAVVLEPDKFGREKESWSLTDVLKTKETFANTLYDLSESEADKEWSLKHLQDARNLLENSAQTVSRYKEREVKSQDESKQFLKDFLDAKLNPKTMLEKHLKSLTPEGFLNNLKYPLEVAMNPIEAIKNDPLVKLGKAVYELADSKLKETFLDNAKAEIKAKIEMLDEAIEPELGEQIRSQESLLQDNLADAQNNLENIENALQEEMGDTSLEALESVEPEFTAAELDSLSTMAIESGNVELLSVYQNAVLAQMENLQAKQIEYATRFADPEISEAATRELMKLEAEPVSEEFVEHLADIFPESAPPANMLEAYEKFSTPEEILENVSQFAGKFQKPIMATELYGESEVLAHFEGQSIIAQQFAVETNQLLLPMTQNAVLTFAPKMEAAQIIQSAQDFANVAQNFSSELSKAFEISANTVQPLVSAQELNLLNNPPIELKAELQVIESGQVSTVSETVAPQLELTEVLQARIEAANIEIAQLQAEIAAEAVVATEGAEIAAILAL